MDDDWSQLHQFLTEGDDAALRRLVEKHAGMVFAVAMRKTGSWQLSEEISQQVFLALIEKAPSLKPGVLISGWLHRATVFQARRALRRDSTYQRKMSEFQQEYSETTLMEDAGEWEEALPLLDDTLNDLESEDRDLILRRFFDGQTFEQIGRSIGQTKSGCRKRILRALDRLSSILQRRGVTVPSGILAFGIASQFTEAAPPTIAHSLASKLSAGASVEASPILTSILPIMTASKQFALGATIIALIAAVPIGLQHQANTRLREELTALRSQPLDIPSTDGMAPELIRVTPDEGGQGTVRSVGDIFTEMRGITRGNDLDSRGRAKLFALAMQLDANAVQEILEELQSLPESAQNQEILKAILSRWAEFDGAAAMAYLEAIPELNKRMPLLYDVVAGWSESAPEEALAWFENAREEGTWGDHDDRAMQAVLRSIFDGLAAQDLDSAFDRIFELDSGWNAAFEGLVSNVREPEKWVELYDRTDQSGHFQAKIYGGAALLEGWSRSDPKSTAAWLATQPTDKRRQVEQIVAGQWFKTDPQAAAEWLVSGASEESRSDQLRLATSMWARRDPYATAEWLATMESSPEVDSARSVLSERILKIDPESAFAWASAVHDEAARSTLQRTLVARWRERDPDGVDAHLRAAGLPAEQLNALLAVPPERDPYAHGSSPVHATRTGGAQSARKR